MRQNALDYFSPTDWDLLVSRSELLKFKLGDEIIHPGSPIHNLFVIHKGSASVELCSAYATTVLATLLEGDVCGELAFLGDGISTAAVVAKDVEVEVYTFDVHDLRQMCADIPGFGLRLYRFLAQSLAHRVKCTSAELIRALDARRSQGQNAGEANGNIQS
jgi:CRP-like cAMP-binding protein